MRPAHLKPLRYDIGNNLPNQVNQELDISEMEIITDFSTPNLLGLAIWTFIIIRFKR